MPVIAAIVKCKKCGAEVNQTGSSALTALTRLHVLESTKPIPKNSILKQLGKID